MENQKSTLLSTLKLQKGPLVHVQKEDPIYLIGSSLHPYLFGLYFKKLK